LIAKCQNAASSNFKNVRKRPSEDIKKSIIMRDKERLVPFMKGTGKPFITRTPNRNAKCECGSGKKQKHCCGCEKEFYVKD